MFMNGLGTYQHPVNTARIATLEKEGHEELYIFYQRVVESAPIGNWRWKLAIDTQDALDFIHGQGAYNYGVPGFEIGVLRKGPDVHFYVFANEGARIWIQSPLENERFIYGEAVHLSAFLTSEQATDVSALSWTSNSGGLLGREADVTVAQLSISTDTITVTGYGIQATRLVRVFADLVNLYRASPAPDEIARIDADFSLQQIDSGRSH
jgi:hypothetical protein